MAAIWTIVWFMISTLAVWQTVEILHHSEAGEIWRRIADKISNRGSTIPKYIGHGMRCPFCYSNWFGFLFFGCGAFMVYPFIAAVMIACVGGLASARAANWLNDIGHDKTRTPNFNSESKSEQEFRQQENENIPPEKSHDET